MKEVLTIPISSTVNDPSLMALLKLNVILLAPVPIPPLDGKNSDVDLTHWDVSHASNANRAFSNAYAFNQDIGSWNVSNVTDMSRMFYNAHTFNQDIDSWNVSKVSTMSYMFYNAHAFNQDISSWDISSLTNAAGMFKGTAMTVDNMDNTLRGWAKLDTAAGETTVPVKVSLPVPPIKVSFVAPPVSVSLPPKPCSVVFVAVV
jgi:surface protein